MGEPREIIYFKDCTKKLPPIYTSSVIKIALHPNRPKLYMITATNVGGSGGKTEEEFLSVYDLDSNGYPIASSLASFLLQVPIYSLAVNAKKNKLYLVGLNSGAVWVWNLDSKGNLVPASLTRFRNIGEEKKYDIAVNPDLPQPLLYLGSSGHETTEPDGPLSLR